MHVKEGEHKRCGSLAPSCMLLIFIKSNFMAWSSYVLLFDSLMLQLDYEGALEYSSA